MSPIIGSTGGLSARAFGLFGAISGGLGDYESIATTTLGSTQSTVTLSSIPSTYKHLQIRTLVRSDRAVSVDSFYFYANSDSTAGGNYYSHGLYGTGTSPAAAYSDGGNFLAVGVLPGSSASSNIFGTHICDVIDYANTNKYKVARSFGGVDLNGSGQIRLVSGLWQSTAAINSITFTTNGGGSFIAGSKFEIYGLKG